MAAKTVNNKPFHLTDRKAGPRNTVNETDVCQFISVIEANIRLHEGWRQVVNQTWEPKNVALRGCPDTDAGRKAAAEIDGMLIYIDTN